MKFVFRGVAQLGLERMVRDHEAGGSNPLAPTRMGSPVTSEDLKGHFRRPNREEQRPRMGAKGNDPGRKERTGWKRLETKSSRPDQYN